MNNRAIQLWCWIYNCDGQIEIDVSRLQKNLGRSTIVQCGRCKWRYRASFGLTNLRREKGEFTIKLLLPSEKE